MADSSLPILDEFAFYITKLLRRDYQAYGSSTFPQGTESKLILWTSIYLVQFVMHPKYLSSLASKVSIHI